MGFAPAVHDMKPAAGVSRSSSSGEQTATNWHGMAPNSVAMQHHTHARITLIHFNWLLSILLRLEEYHVEHQCLLAHVQPSCRCNCLHVKPTLDWKIQAADGCTCTAFKCAVLQDCLSCGHCEHAASFKEGSEQLSRQICAYQQ